MLSKAITSSPSQRQKLVQIRRVAQKQNGRAQAAAEAGKAVSGRENGTVATLKDNYGFIRCAVAQCIIKRILNA